MPKDVTLKIRLTPSELDGLRRHATAEATTLSALVRAGVVIHRKPVLTSQYLDALEALREEVRRVGPKTAASNACGAKRSSLRDHFTRRCARTRCRSQRRRSA